MDTQSSVPLKVRAAVILIEEGRVALIRRVRGGEVYFLFPGGTVEVGETATQAAVREAREELGLDVRIGELVAVVEFAGCEQHYFRATVVGREFGTGEGEELHSSAESESGSYSPTWLEIGALASHDVLPPALAELLHSRDLATHPVPLKLVEERRTVRR